MTGNSLYEPLGQTGGDPPPRRRLATRGTALVLGVCGLIAAGGWTLWRIPRQPDRSVAVVPIGPLVVPAPPAPRSEAPPPVKTVLSSDEIERQSGVTVMRPPGTSAPAGALITVPQTEQVALRPVPDPRLVEKSRYGLLPRRGADGARAADVYARPVVQDPTLGASAPRIAIFVGGMGLNRALTAEAAQALPPAVSFGFAPYGGDLGLQVQGARDLGHEAILQVPMESFNDPDGTTMPRLLAAADSPKIVADDLHWQMARFVGYAGIANFLGAKFTADAAAFEPVLREVAERGLFYFDDGTAPRNLASTIGPPLGLQTLRADVVIDALGEPAAIDAGLKKLETLARDHGSAVGSTTGLPMTVDRIAVFAKGLAGRGVSLVPVSSLAAVSAVANAR